MNPDNICLLSGFFCPGVSASLNHQEKNNRITAAKKTTNHQQMKVHNPWRI
jgi:hypothetical protein